VVLLDLADGIGMPGWLTSWPDKMLDCHIEVDDNAGWTHLLQGATDAPPDGDSTFAVAGSNGRRLTLTARLDASGRLRQDSNIVIGTLLRR
jgi:hypothetical protein